VEDTGYEMVVQDTGSEPEEEVWEREVGGLRLLGRLSTSGCTKQAVKAVIVVVVVHLLGAVVE